MNYYQYNITARLSKSIESVKLSQHLRTEVCLKQKVLTARITAA